MTSDTIKTEAAERLERLRRARDKIEAQLDDPRTPPYSIAPLTNQLRLTDKEIFRLTRAEAEAEDGLPSDPEKVTFVDLLRYRRSLRHAVVNPRGHRGRDRRSAWAEAEAEIFATWAAAGFEVLPLPTSDPAHMDLPREEAQAARVAWIEGCRAELVRCLKEHADEAD